MAALVHVVQRWWARQPGELVCLAAGSPPRSYFFDADTVDIAAFIAEHDGENCFFVPHLFSRPRRKKENSILPHGLYADLDAVDPRTLALRPTVAIQSSPGRYVALWLTDRAAPEHLNKRNTYDTGADHNGWCLTKLLRLPGSRNFKYPDRPTARVMWSDWNVRYRVADLELQLPPLTLYKSGKKNPRRRSPLTPQQIIDKHGIRGWLRYRLLDPDGQLCGERRHRLHWRLAKELYEADVPASEAFVCLWETNWNKHRLQGDGEDAVWDMIDKIW